MSSEAPEGPIEVLTVFDKTVRCDVAHWPTETVPSSAIYAKAHWRPKSLLVKNRLTQVGFAKVIKENAPKHATPEYLVFCRVAFPAEGEDAVEVPDISKNERGRNSGPVFFEPPTDLPVGCERYEEIPHELYGHIHPPAKIEWPSVLRRRNHRTVKGPDGTEKNVPILPSYLYDERVRFEKWKVALLTWWQSARESRVGSHRLMRWQNIFQSFRRDFPSFPTDAGAVRRFSSIVQAYERELAAGRSVAIKSDLAPEDQHNRPAAGGPAGPAGGSRHSYEEEEEDMSAVKQKPLGPVLSDDDESSDDDEDEAEKKKGAAKAKTAGTKAAMAAARARIQDSDSDSDSSSSESGSESESESEEEVKVPAKKKVAPAPAPAAAKKRAAPTNFDSSSSESSDSGSDSDSDSDSEVPAPAPKRAAAPAAAASKGKAKEQARRNFDDSDSDSDSESEEEAPKAKKSKKAVKGK